MSQITSGSSGDVSGVIKKIIPDAGDNVTPNSAGEIGIVGGSNITTTGAGFEVTVNLDSSPSVSGSITAGTGATVTTGDVTVTSGNVLLPTTSSTEGQVQVNGTRFAHAYGLDNTFIGELSGNFTLTGEFNSGVGSGTLTYLTSGHSNCAFGSGSIEANEAGTINSGFGLGTLNLNEGSLNTAIGGVALKDILTGSGNTTLGAYSGKNYIGAESNNILIGSEGIAGESNKIRIGETGTGSQEQDACYIAGIYGVTPGGTLNMATVDSNGQFGSAALPTDELPSGGVTGETLMAVTGTDPVWDSSPTFSGLATAAGLTSSSGDVTVTAGNVLLPTTSATVGQVQINGHSFMHAYGTGSTFLGDLAGNTSLTNVSNTGIGFQSLNALTSGARNVAVGLQSGLHITEGSTNVSIGTTSCKTLTTGTENTAVGDGSLYSLTTAAGNVSIGTSNLFDCVIGEENTSSGAYALQHCTGDKNTAVGYQSGNTFVDGDFNSFFGYLSGNSHTTTDSSNICIANSGVVGESNVMRLGTTGSGDRQIDSTYMAGTYQETVDSGTLEIGTIDSTEKLGSISIAALKVLLGLP